MAQIGITPAKREELVSEAMSEIRYWEQFQNEFEDKVAKANAKVRKAEEERQELLDLRARVPELVAALQRKIAHLNKEVVRHENAPKINKAAKLLQQIRELQAQQ